MAAEDSVSPEQFGDTVKAWKAGKSGSRDDSAMQSAMDTHATVIPKALHRGMSVQGEPEKYEVGSTVSLPPTGFSPNRAVAKKFSNFHKDGHPVIMSVEPGARALHLNKLAPGAAHRGENEHVSSGQFHVTSVEQKGKALHVGLKHLPKE